MRKCAVLLIGIFVALGLFAATVQAQEAPPTTARAHEYPAVDLVDDRSQYDGTTHIHYLFPPGEMSGEATQASDREKEPWFRPVIVALSVIGTAIGWGLGAQAKKETRPT